MNNFSEDAKRQETWSAARVAVRAYAKDPSQGNAEQVENACSAVRQIKSLTVWRELQAAWLDSGDRR